jgi:hypothetical protein
MKKDRNKKKVFFLKEVYFPIEDENGIERRRK